MRKTYTFISLFFIGILMLNAQTNLPTISPQSLNQPYPYQIGTKHTNKMVNCIDTIRYPGSKLTGLVEVDTMNIAGYIGAVSQAYYFSGVGTISGISAYVLLDLDGIPANAPAITMTIRVYDIDALNKPTTMIASTDVQVLDVGFQEQPLLFSSPVSVTDSFAITLEINPTFPVRPYYVTNTSANSDGNGEALSSITFNGTWFNALVEVGGWDMDLMLAPIFEQTFTASYTVDTNRICLGDSVTFTNTVPSQTNPMFNPFANTNSLDFDDGGALVPSFDSTLTHTYVTTGVHNPLMQLDHIGYTSNCFDNSSLTVTVLDLAGANFSFVDNGGGNFQFTDLSTNTNTWSWNFGDGSPISNLQNPSHTFSFGNYIICLTVSDSNGCNTSTACDTISFTVGIENVNTVEDVKIYPIPAKNYFNVSIPSSYLNGEIIITDLVGQQLKSIAINNQKKVKILTEEIASGIYFISIDYDGERFLTQRIIIDK